MEIIFLFFEIEEWLRIFIIFRLRICGILLGFVVFVGGGVLI